MRAILNELRASLTRNTSMTISLIVTMSVSLLLASLGLPPGPPACAVPAFARMLEDGSLPREPWVFDPAAFAGA